MYLQCAHFVYKTLFSSFKTLRGPVWSRTKTPLLVKYLPQVSENVYIMHTISLISQTSLPPGNMYNQIYKTKGLSDKQWQQSAWFLRGKNLYQLKSFLLTARVSVLLDFPVVSVQNQLLYSNLNQFCLDYSIFSLKNQFGHSWNSAPVQPVLPTAYPDTWLCNDKVMSVLFSGISILVHYWLQDRDGDLVGKIRLAEERVWVIIR